MIGYGEARWSRSPIPFATASVNEQSDGAHWSEMTAFGRDEILTETEILQVVHYVRQLAGLENDAAHSVPGGEIFLNECSVCHLEDGTGDPEQGSPNLADAIWLFGSSIEDLIENGKQFSIRRDAGLGRGIPGRWRPGRCRSQCGCGIRSQLRWRAVIGSGHRIVRGFIEPKRFEWNQLCGLRAFHWMDTLAWSGFLASGSYLSLDSWFGRSPME